MAYPAQLGDIQARIGARLQDRTFQSIPLADVTDIINQSLAYYKYKRFWFNEAVTTITLNQGDPLVPNIPADFLEELPNGGLVIHYSTVHYLIEKRSSFIFDGEDVQGVGLPYIYCFRNGSFYLYFYPNIAYSLIFRYLRDYQPFANVTDTNDFLTYADRMIEYNALSRIYSEYKQDATMEQYYTARADDEERNLRRRSSALTGTGTLTLQSYLIS